MARLTLWGINNVYPLFDDITLPEGLDKDALVDVIMDFDGMLFPYHQTPPILQSHIKRWFSQRLEDFTRMYKAVTAEYNPIHNYDRTEDHTVQHKDSGTDTDTSQDSGTDKTSLKTGGEDTVSVVHGGTDTRNSKNGGQDTTSGTNTQTQQVSAFDADTFVNREKTDGTQSGSTTYGQTVDETVQHGATQDDTTMYGRTEDGSTEYGKKNVNTRDYGKQVDETGKLRAYGNIGVTTTQQMISAELEMRRNYDVYLIIQQLFEDRFIMQVY